MQMTPACSRSWESSLWDSGHLCSLLRHVSLSRFNNLWISLPDEQALKQPKPLILRTDNKMIYDAESEERNFKFPSTSSQPGAE
jgi:hypothetical protein